MKDIKVTEERCLELSLIILEGIPGVKFDMCTFYEECGTAGCIGGYAVATYDPKLWASSKGQDVLTSCDAEDRIKDRAIELLGLSRIEAGEMFCPWASTSLHQAGKYAPHSLAITPEMAAETLVHFARTKKIVWRHK